MQQGWRLSEAIFKIIMAATIQKNPFWNMMSCSTGEINDFWGKQLFSL